MKLTVVATLFGIELPRTVNELHLSNGRIFKNPILLNENWGLSFGSNLTLYKEHEGKREIDRDVVKYLLDLEIDTADGSLDMGSWHASLTGSGGASFPTRTGAQLKGNLKEEIEKITLPLLLGTKARIIAIPAKVQGGSRDEVSKNGIDQPMNMPMSNFIFCELSEDDCSFISKLSDKISKVDLSPYKVPIEIFQDSFHNANDIERSLSLITALESLFSQGSDSISFKLAYRTSCFLYFSDIKMYSTFKFIKKSIQIQK